MSLDVTVIVQRDILCPHCGKVAGGETVAEEYSGGRVWYPILEKLGYYVEDGVSEWYGKDMVLTDAQAKMVYEFVKTNPVYCGEVILRMIATAQMDGNKVVINADW